MQFSVEANEAVFVGSIATPCAETIGLRGADDDTWRRYFAAHVADQLRSNRYEAGEGRVTLREAVPGGMIAEVRMMALGPDAVLVGVAVGWNYPPVDMLRPSPGRTVEP